MSGGLDWIPSDPTRGSVCPTVLLYPHPLSFFLSLSLSLFLFLSFHFAQAQGTRLMAGNLVREDWTRERNSFEPAGAWFFCIWGSSLCVVWMYVSAFAMLYYIYMYICTCYLGIIRVAIPSLATGTGRRVERYLSSNEEDDEDTVLPHRLTTLSHSFNFSFY